MRSMWLLLALAACKNDREAVGVFGYHNIDDDNADGERDWVVADATDDDVTPLVLEANKGATRELELTLSDAASIRVWHDGQLLLDADTLSATIPYDKKAPPTLHFEFGAYKLDEVLTVVEKNKKGKAIGDPWTLPVRSGPFLLNHHLLPAIQVQSVSITGYTDPMVDTYEELLGDRYLAARGADYGFDVWMQDEIEYGTTHGREGQTGAVIDSIRDRGLDWFAEAEVVGPGIGKIVRGNPDNVTSQDSFGNLEVSPPVTVGERTYPFGRIYWGDSDGRGIDPALASFLEENGAQEPFTLDVSWLCVGHVDEFVAFVPDQSSPKGFKVAIADTNRAWQLLEQMDPTTQLPQYREDYGVFTVGQLVDDTALRALNDDTQATWIDPAKQKLIDELGLEESDFIYVPDIFERAPGCFGTQAALIPGMVNLVVDNPRDSTSRIFMADPFVRNNLQAQENDPFIAEMRRIMPPEHELVFVDNWEAYHVALGEVHCGTNVIRASHEVPWWPESQRELDEEEGR